jgi:hypothetical protein
MRGVVGVIWVMWQDIGVRCLKRASFAIFAQLKPNRDYH